MVYSPDSNAWYLGRVVDSSAEEVKASFFPDPLNIWPLGGHTSLNGQMMLLFACVRAPDRADPLGRLAGGRGRVDPQGQ